MKEIRVMGQDDKIYTLSVQELLKDYNKTKRRDTINHFCFLRDVVNRNLWVYCQDS